MAVKKKDMTDNVIPFRKEVKTSPSNQRAAKRYSPFAQQFPHHDRVVRLNLRGLVRDDAFVRWLVEEAVALRLDGWAKNRTEGDMDVLLAGEVGDVGQMLDLLRHGPRPVDMLLVEETILKGDEPLWSGFHHLSPSEV